MSQIRKHTLDRGTTWMEVPGGTKVLAVGVQAGDVHCIWTQELSNRALSGRERWRVVVAMTGDYVEDSEGWEHLGSWVGLDGNGADYTAHFYLARL